MGSLFSIERLDLENFRGFRKFGVSFHPEVTVVVGENGAGKTSLIEALRLVVEAYWGDEVGIQARDVRRVLVEREGVSLEEKHNVELKHVVSLLGGSSFQERLVLFAPPRESRSDMMGGARSQFLHDIESQLTDLPLLALYPADRSWNITADPDDRTLPSRTDLLKNWSATRKSFAQLLTWIRRQTFASLQRGTPQPHLTAIQNAVVGCITDATRFYYDIQNEDLFIELSSGQKIPFSLLSDGYQNMVAILADLAWRAVILNPHHAERAPQEAQGVVLIDEVDLHIHPRWQRRILSDLRKVFPKLQFIVTTHSPQVIASARKEWVRVLAGGEEAREAGFVEGRDSSSILADVMGDSGRPRDMQNRLARLYDLIEEEKTEAALAEVAELEKLLGPDDTDMVRARTMLSFPD